MESTNINFGDEFLCGQCQEKFSTLTLFLLHKIQHVDTGKPGGCPLCGMAFTRQVSLREHLIRKHNIPQIKSASTSGKQRGKLRKEAAETNVSKETGHNTDSGNDTGTTQTESKILVTRPANGAMASRTESPVIASSTRGEVALPSPALSESDSSTGPHTMHIIIDKIGEGALHTADLSSATLQANCSVFPSTASSTLVGTPDMSGLGQLIEQVASVSQPQSFAESSPGAHHQPACVQNQTRIFDNQTHTIQSQCHPVQGKLSHIGQDSSRVLQSQSVTLHDPHTVDNDSSMLEPLQDTASRLSQDGHTTRNVATDNLKPASTPGNKHSLYSQSQQLSSIKSPKSLDEEADFDFLFVLLTNHVKRKSFNYSKQVFKCFHCHYKTTWRRALVKHMKESHADNLAVHQCITVNKTEKLQDQQVMKMSEYTLVLARQRRQVNSHRVRGVERQDLPGYHPCNKCDKVFGRLRYLRKHQVIHKVEKKFLCDDCGKAFKTKAYLAAHRQTHQAKVYNCSQCDFSSSINALIHTHRQLHNGNSVICEVCGSAYNDRATLKKHKQVHDEARPYPCTYPGCTWRFKSEVMCRAHFRGHTTSGRFVCHLCSYVFRHKHHLQRHLGKVHGMDDATVYRTTCSNRAQPHSKTVTMESCEDKQLVQVVQEEDQPLTDTVDLIVNSGLSTEQLQSVLESGQFVIATDDNHSSVNYEVANITMNVSYDSLAESAGGVMEGQAILIPNDAECSQIIFQQETEAVPASIET